MQFILLKENSPSWNFIWDWLAKHPINEGIAEPIMALNENEAWQYMGTYKQDEKVISEFRHRKHPRTNNVYYLRISHAINPEDIQKSYNL